MAAARTPTARKAADSCPAGPGTFPGADFPFLSANVVRTDTGQTLFPPYVVKDLGGVKIGFIGMTLKGTPDIVTAAGVQGLTFLDEVSTANKYADIAAEAGRARRSSCSSTRAASPAAAPTTTTATRAATSA